MLEIQKEEQYTVINLSRAEKRNALSCALMKELIQAIDETHQDPFQRVLILRGEGPVFCAGLDLEELRDRSKKKTSTKLLSQLLQQVYTSTLVTICCVHGASVAGGAALMAACDLVVAEVDAKIGFPEARRGIVAGFVSALLTRQIRQKDVKELLLLGELVSAERAREMGLVTRVVPKGKSFHECMEMTGSVLKGAPNTLRFSKELLEQLDPVALDKAWEVAQVYHIKSRATDEAQEGALAFLEKREPNWIAK